jgi:serine/threonine-protein phosphatase 5
MDDDLTPFPSPVLSATSLAGLSCESAQSFNTSRNEESTANDFKVSSDGELEPEVDEDRIVTDQDKEQAADLKAQANKAFAGE